MGLIVQKYGGSSVANAEKILRVANRVIKTKQAGNKVVVVVSAMGDMTDDLIDLITSAFSQKRQSNEISEGLKPDLFHQFVKELATGSYRSN